MNILGFVVIMWLFMPYLVWRVVIETAKLLLSRGRR